MVTCIVSSIIDKQQFLFKSPSLTTIANIVDTFFKYFMFI